MDTPQPPQDQELRNIIDKLAQFVARNGPEFEQMTKLKQKDNPKFSFLFGGEHFNYYQYQVTTLQAAMKQKEAQAVMGGQPAPTPIQTGPPQVQQGLMVTPPGLAAPQGAAWQTGIPPVAAIAQVQQQVQELQDQIRQSEQNLAAQHQVLLQQQQVQLDEAIRKAQDDKLASKASECDIDILELDKILQPIIESCTKDAISSGKGWIFSHSTTPERNELICQYLLKKVTVPGAAFDMKLHIVYLINDVLHHCVRKNADELKLALDKVVVPIFCTTSIGVDDDKGQKLAKLLKLWETNKYFEPAVLEQLKSPTISIANYQASLITEHAPVITAVTTGVQAKYVQLQKQHQDFVTHLTTRIQALQLGLMQVPAPMLQPGLQQPPPITQQPPPITQQPPPIAQQQATLAPPQVSTPQTTVPPPSDPSQQAPMASQPTTPVTSAPLVAAAPQAQNSPMTEAAGSNDAEAQQYRQGNGDEPMSMRDSHMPPDDQRPPHNMHGGMHDMPPRDLPPRDMPPRDMMGGMGHPNHGGYGGRGPGMDSGPYHGGPPMGRHPGMGGPPYMGNGPPGYNQSQMYGPRPPGGFGRHGPPPPDYPMGPGGPHGGPPGYGCGGPPRHPMHDFDYDPRDDYYDDYEMDCKFNDRMDFFVDHPEDPCMIDPDKSDFYPGPGPGPGHGMGLPDITKPPPGFMHGDMSECLIPTVPYFDLPAGLIVPLVKLSDCDYKPMDPNDIRLPPPAPPSEALLNAVEMFYAPPTHERPRNSEGWEQLGLYEFFKAKSQHTKKKSYHDSEGNSDEDSPGKNEDHRMSPPRDEPPPQRRRYRESKSPPPVIKEEDPERERRKSKKKSRSRSPARSRSRSPPPHRQRRRRSSSSRSRSRSPGSPSVRKRSPDRSPTPPSFFGSSYGGDPMTSRLDESNKGHQLLRKMGWGGAGLGAAEQGIQDPIHAGDVRDRQDMYKGIGISLNDPYESFRKSKGQAFINRMKARQEELGGVAGK